MVWFIKICEIEINIIKLIQGKLNWKHIIFRNIRILFDEYVDILMNFYTGDFQTYTIIIDL